MSHAAAESHRSTRVFDPADRGRLLLTVVWDGLWASGCLRASGVIHPVTPDTGELCKLQQ